MPRQQFAHLALLSRGILLPYIRRELPKVVRSLIWWTTPMLRASSRAGEGCRALAFYYSPYRLFFARAHCARYSFRAFCRRTSLSNRPTIATFIAFSELSASCVQPGELAPMSYCGWHSGLLNTEQPPWQGICPVGQVRCGGGPEQSAGPNVTSIASLQRACPDFIAHTATAAFP